MIPKVLNHVYQATGVTPADILGTSKTPHVVWARHVAMYLVHHALRYSYVATSKAFNCHAHATAIHADRRVTAHAAKDVGFATWLKASVSDLNKPMGGLPTVLHTD